jgi:hypothetical protein
MRPPVYDHPWLVSFAFKLKQLVIDGIEAV